MRNPNLAGAIPSELFSNTLLDMIEPCGASGVDGSEWIISLWDKEVDSAIMETDADICVGVF